MEVKTTNHLGGYTNTETELDFAGVAQRTNTYHLRRQGEIGVTLQERFIYDSQNRLLQHYHKVDDQTEVLLAENTYNELSQLSNKKVGNNLQSIDYNYNIRGWLTWINRDQMTVPDLDGKVFSYKIKYNEKEGITSPSSLQFPGKEVAAKYNGNIAEVDWRSVENIGNYPSLTPKRYGYVYDRLNRLTAGFYQTPNNASIGENTESIGYDLNGNITSLFRTSVLENGSTTPTKIDDLQYIYSSQNKSNKLITINDNSFNPTGYEGGGMEIKYDVNGNMTEMPDKGINKIDYNYLNLPGKISYSKGGTESAIVNTRYSADGIKLQKENNTTVFGFNGSSTTTKITDYLDGFQYLMTLTPPPPGGFESLMMASSETGRALERQAYSIDNDSSFTLNTLTLKNKDLQFFPTAEGFYDYKKDQYIYQYQDHLGNTRISFVRNSAGTLEIVDANDYYPFGMNHLNSGISFFGVSSYKNYNYNGKELQETGMYDYGARMYMTDIGRWGIIDPASEHVPEFSPYNFTFNDPIGFTDNDGEFPGSTDAVIGILADYIGQVAGHYFFDSMSFRDSMIRDINYWSLGISGVTGALTGGIDSFKNTLTSGVGKKIFVNMIDYGVDVLVNTVGGVLSNQLDEGEFDVWKSLTGGLIEASLGRVIPLKYVYKLEKKLLHKMGVNANKAAKIKSKSGNVTRKKTIRKLEAKLKIAENNVTNYTSAYTGVKTVNDVFKKTGVNGLTDQLFKKEDNSKKEGKLKVGEVIGEGRIPN